MIASSKEPYSNAAKFFSMVMEISFIIIDDFMLFKFFIAQNNNVMNIIPNENTNFVFQISEFKFSEFWFLKSLKSERPKRTIL